MLRSEISVKLARALVRGGNATWGFTGFAIWDTGATKSCISKKVASTLGLLPISRTTVHAAGNSFDSPVYKVDFLLPNSLTVHDVDVTEGSNLQGCDILLGMDIITVGDFAVTNGGGMTVFSFRFPPADRHIDFVEAANKIKSEREHKEQTRRQLKRRFK